MDMELSTPALLFPAVSLLFLSYTNRFLALSSLIRRLHEEWQNKGDGNGEIVLAQILNLRHRLVLIRWMQVSGAVSLFFCVISMASMLMDWRLLGLCMFIGALFLMGVSLIALIREASVSGGALRILLDQAEVLRDAKKPRE